MPAIPATPTGAGALVTLDALGRLPPLDGSQLTGIGGSSNVVLHDDFFTSAATTQGDIGQSGWRFARNGTANAINPIGVAGHPGVIQMVPGTAALGRVCLFLGNSGVTSVVLSNTGLQTPFTIEFLLRFTGSIAAADLEIAQVGLLTNGDTGGNGESTGDALYIRFNPAASANFVLVARSGGLASTSAGTTAVVLNTWYRVAIVFTDNGGGSASAQLQVNGINEGAAVTTNLPIGVQFSPTMKIDGVGSGVALALEVDRVRVLQAVTP